MKKIDVSKFDHFVFNDFARTFFDQRPQLYKSGDYIEYIKSQCIGRFFSDCNFLFSMHNNSVPTCYLFPESGREHSHQAFKKLGVAEKIQQFNECNLNFYKVLAPDFERVVSMMTEHHRRWKALVKELKAVDLIQELQSMYKMSKNTLGNDNRIYEIYYIYENQYLHHQFDRFISAKDFNEWWSTEALPVLTC